MSWFLSFHLSFVVGEKLFNLLRLFWIGMINYCYYWLFHVEKSVDYSILKLLNVFYSAHVVLPF